MARLKDDGYGMSIRREIESRTRRGVSIGATLERLERKGFLFEVSGTDPLTLGSMAALFGLVALVASYVPAMRASRLDPVQALRND